MHACLYKNIFVHLIALHKAVATLVPYFLLLWWRSEVKDINTLFLESATTHDN